VGIGYACLTVGVPNTNMKSCVLKNANEDKLAQLIAHNLDSLENIIEYNIKNGIGGFRISSDIIPFGSSPVNTIAWQEIFNSQLQRIGHKISSSGMRVSMHPGQYTVLNSPSAETAKKAVDDLNYHTRVLTSLGTDASHKIVLHIGGAYQDKWQAMKRFISRFRSLDELVKQRLVIENDERLFNIEDVLEVGSTLGIPVVFDKLHHEINPCTLQKSIAEWIEVCAKTWRKQDGRQKIHYSQQDFQKKKGSHSKTILIDPFIAFYECLFNVDIDIMLEVKDKNLSAIKCLNCLSKDKHIKALEAEWSHYKYNVLEQSPADYLEIRELLKNKMEYPALGFYRILEKALQKSYETGNIVNAAQHVWGYFKDIATATEKESFHIRVFKYQQGKAKASTIKNFLWKMAIKYHENYLLNSYYFVI